MIIKPVQSSRIVPQATKAPAATKSDQACHVFALQAVWKEAMVSFYRQACFANPCLPRTKGELLQVLRRAKGLIVPVIVFP